MSLADRLAARGIAPPPWDETLEEAERRGVLADPYRGFAELDAPLPEADGAPGASPRGAVLSLRALDVGDGDRVLVVGPGGAYAAEVAGARAEEAEAARSLDEAGGGERDRILWLAEGEPPDAAADLLAGMGTLLHTRGTGVGLEVVKLVRSGDGAAEVGLGEAVPADDPWGSRGEGPSPDRSLGAILGMEAALKRVWTGEVRGRRERRWAEAADETWRPDPPGDVGGERWDRARRLFRIGYALQQATDLETAREAYTASLEMAPSAEAYTFRGWVESFRGRYQEAIEDCERAIEADPSLGNPYNDIGCYLLELGRLDEAEEWFRRAAEADRYEAPHYPHLNMARVHLARGEVEEAEAAARRSLEIEPGDPAAQALLRRIRDERG